MNEGRDRVRIPRCVVTRKGEKEWPHIQTIVLSVCGEEDNETGVDSMSRWGVN